MILKIIRSLMCYILFCAVKTLVVGIALFPFLNEQITFNTFILQCTLNDESNIIINNYTVLVQSASSVLDLLSGAIFTGYIFAYILNREPKIVFPDKLVIRHRTSGDAAHKLAMGVIIANKSHFNLYNVKCSIVFSYRKRVYPGVIVSDTTLKDERFILENFYRFSFYLVDFPKEILMRIVEENYGTDDSITVSVNGNTNFIGNTFQLERKYKLNDIVFDEHVVDAISYCENPITGEKIKSPFNHKEIRRIRWDDVMRIKEVGAEQRKMYIDEIREIIYQ